MHVSDWTPPKTPEQGETHLHGGHQDGSVARPLIVLVAVVFIAISVMFAYDHAARHPTCTAQATVEAC